MNIILDKAGKRFNKDWIFREFSFNFQQGKKYAITGPNGSGKSTLLQVIAGSMNVTEGTVHYSDGSRQLPEDKIYKYVSIAAPYLEVIEEMTAAEFLEFHSVFKRLVLPIEQILTIINLDQTKGKQIRNFSSGMKQRVKLAQAIFSDTPVLLLDEPCTNFDAAGYELYHRLIDKHSENKLVIVSSNDANEYSFCDESINVMQYKITSGNIMV
jgi:ABC-type multidrug transport system ATPase subunit